MRVCTVRELRLVSFSSSLETKQATAAVGHRRRRPVAFSYVRLHSTASNTKWLYMYGMAAAALVLPRACNACDSAAKRERECSCTRVSHGCLALTTYYTRPPASGAALFFIGCLRATSMAAIGFERLRDKRQS